MADPLDEVVSRRLWFSSCRSLLLDAAALLDLVEQLERPAARRGT